MIRKRELYRSWLLLALLPILVASCSVDLRCILPADIKLRAGDVVFRRGGSLSSRAVLMADSSRGYSHVGMVVDSAGYAMIVHAVPGEPDFIGDVDRVKLEKPQDFFSSERAVTGEIRRADNYQMAKAASLNALAYYARRARFDHDYNAADSVEVYCTELIVRAYREAGAPLNNLKYRHINLPGFSHDCILPSALATHSYFRLVRAF